MICSAICLPQAEAAAKESKLADREAAAAAKEAELQRAANDVDQQQQASQADQDAAAAAQKAAAAVQKQLDKREAALQASPEFRQPQGFSTKGAVQGACSSVGDSSCEVEQELASSTEGGSHVALSRRGVTGLNDAPPVAPGSPAPFWVAWSMCYGIQGRGTRPSADARGLDVLPQNCFQSPVICSAHACNFIQQGSCVGHWRALAGLLHPTIHSSD